MSFLTKAILLSLLVALLYSQTTSDQAHYTLNGQTINPSDKNFIDARMEGLKKKLVEQLGAKKKDSQSASKKDLI